MKDAAIITGAYILFWYDVLIGDDLSFKVWLTVMSSLGL